MVLNNRSLRCVKVLNNNNGHVKVFASSVGTCVALQIALIVKEKIDSFKKLFKIISYFKTFSK